LTADASLQTERLAAARMAKRAYELSTQIPSTYLASSNSDLPGVYRSCFVRAMELWKCGLEASNESLVAEGIARYNAFLIWMQSKERNDFNSIR
jgi:hypothetical protein